ncbi:MAG: DUF1674 domain-containing protein [Alphaproteobacteria bacterium]|nr:DUF1674 domain-containing protein [Alphaproteobacteria bacterium]
MSDQIPSNNRSGADSEGKNAGKDDEKEKEIGGFENRVELTRYGDWDANGRYSDF